ncbi:MAG: serine O-acetyltransferase [Methylophilaceae bacterium]
MIKILQSIAFLIRSAMLLPHLTILIFTNKNAFIHTDLLRWMDVCFNQKNEGARVLSFLKLMCHYQAFRNLFYYRVGMIGRLFSFLCPPLPSLYICTKTIGPGLFIQHGFSTIIIAEKIGANCWINQQVTIGAVDNHGLPKIEDNVTIGAGAIILGDITIAENSKVGANAVVVKNVPRDVTVVGVPAYIIKKNGQRIVEAL